MKEISAGGIVFRKNSDVIEVIELHDRYARFSIPKGKMEPGETIEQTALREIVEETGIQGAIIQPLHTVYYQYYHPKHGPTDKEVHYFLVEAVGGVLEPQLSEISSVAWVSMDEAWSKQLEIGYDNNLVVWEKALSALGQKNAKE